MPEGLDPAFWDEKTGLKAADLSAHLNELRAFKAAQDSRAAAVPDDPAKYELKLPEDWKPPVEGVEFQLDPNNPLVSLARKVAHATGRDQADFETMVGIYASELVESSQRLLARQEAEMAAVNQRLGPKADERRAAVETWIAATMGPAQVQKFKNEMLLDADLVEGFEKAIRHASSGGAPAFSQTGRTPGEPGITDEDWNRMSLTDRLRTTMNVNTRRVA